MSAGPRPATAAEALRRLQEGNRRFVANEQQATRHVNLAAAQQPFAVVLGCSDSRVPVEIVFDQDLGDLFVIRVAGNIVAPSLVGSVEFAAAKFGTPLVVVLGHTACGAVLATLEEMRLGSGLQSPNLRSIVDRIRPGIEGLLDTSLAADSARLMAAAVRSNVRASVGQLKHGSAIIEGLVADGKLQIVGAEYCLDTGVVEFLDGATG